MNGRRATRWRWAAFLAFGLFAATAVALHLDGDNGWLVGSSNPEPQPGGEADILVVGTDIEPGLYVSTVAQGSSTCSWERIEDIEARYVVPVASNEGLAGAQVVVEILESDSGFRSSGCGEWRQYSPPDSFLTSMTSGTWLVGMDIAPGRYRSEGAVDASEPCEWSRQLGLSDGFYDIAQSGQTLGPVTVEISPEDVSFTSTACADWSLVGDS